MPPEDGVHGNPHDRCAKMCRRYVGSAIWRSSVKKNPGKTYRGKTTGGLQQPPWLYKGYIQSRQTFGDVSESDDVINL